MRRLSLSFLSVLLFLLASCHKQQPASETQNSQPSPWQMTLVTDPTPPVEDQATAFKVSLRGTSSGQPVAGAEVRAELKMTTMDMGKNEVTLADKGYGTYEGNGTFTMAGPWKVTVTAKQGDKSGQQTFDIVAHRKP